jgi:Ca-activated chloride channel homolog
MTYQKMKKKIYFLSTTFYLLLTAYCLLPTASHSQTTRVLFVFDASNSMKTMYDGKPRIEHAKTLFYKFIDSLDNLKNYEFALRMYGNTVKYPPGDCNDSKLIVPFEKNNIQKIKDAVKQVQPTGITPIEHSLTQAATDFPDVKSINTIILITDGIEECGGDPCKARIALQEKGIILKPCIIGIGLTPEQAKAFDCVGNYFSYEEPDVFKNSVDYITTQKLNRTTAQINLLDVGSKPTETNVNMTFYNEKTGNIMYNYVHSMNTKGYPDTIPMDETTKYTIVANTIPQKQIHGITLNIGTHNVIPIDAPQGVLAVKRSGGLYNNNDKAKCIIRQTDNMQTLHVMSLNTTERFIVGEYDLEILTLPRTYVSKVKINQTITKNVNVEDAGQVKINMSEYGDGCILVEEGKELKWVCNLPYNQTRQEFNLQPGTYHVTFRGKSLKQSIYTIEKKFTVKSNQVLTVDLYR